MLASGMLVAQSDQPTTTTDTGRDPNGVTRVVTPQQHEKNWGWIGLLGLIGLAGLRRKSNVQEYRQPENIRRVA